MKRVVLLIAVLAAFGIVRAQQGYEVHVKLKHLEEGSVVISYVTSSGYTVDTSTSIRNGVYIFKGTVTEPIAASVVVRKSSINIKTGKGMIPSPSLPIVLTNDKITVDGDANEIYRASVHGGKANEEWNKIKSKQAQLTHAQWTAMKKAYNNPAGTVDTVLLKSARELRETNTASNEMLELTFMHEHPNSFVSMHFLSGMLNSLSLQELEKEYSQLGSTYKGTAAAKRVVQKISSLNATSIGKAAINLDKKDMNGNTVNLNVLKGKYVLLDFWGSWCGPCRSGHPHLKDLYAKYQSKGFEIVGIASEQGRSIEQSRTSWKKAIGEDGITWLQVLNNEDIERFDAVKAYGVTAFPTKILLDKEGNIIWRHVGDTDELDKKLEEVLGK